MARFVIDDKAVILDLLDNVDSNNTKKSIKCGRSSDSVAPISVLGIGFLNWLFVPLSVGHKTLNSHEGKTVCPI